MTGAPKKTAGDGGFSLIELMIVVAIIAILAAVAIPAYFNHTMRSRQSAVVGELMSIKAAQERYFADNGGWYAAQVNSLDKYAVAGTYTNGDYRYWISPTTSSTRIRTGDIMAEGDLNGDGVFSDRWQVSIDDLSGKPQNTSTNEGFSWSSLGKLF